MKKFSVLALSALLLMGCSTAPAQKTDAELEAEGWVKNPLENGYVMATDAPAPTALPDPRDTTKMYKPSKDEAEVACTADSYAAACSSINVDNLIDYLGRDDVVYIDLRDYNDYAKKHLKNFEVIPYFAVIFNADANTDATLPQLYGGSVTEPIDVYEESDDLLHAMIPSDKTVFLMCQSGGRVTQLMNLLAAKGYDMSKIYNVGGMGQFEGSEFRPYTTDNAELAVTATYAFEGLTRKQAQNSQLKSKYDVKRAAEVFDCDLCRFSYIKVDEDSGERTEGRIVLKSVFFHLMNEIFYDLRYND